MLYCGQGGYHLQQYSIESLSTADSVDLPYASELFAGVAVAALKLVALKHMFPFSKTFDLSAMGEYFPHQINGLVDRLIIIAADAT
eukprot:scaffold102875_cov24-Prasinocladus_malaysianus.AAC.1